jgi:hypothetical protein
LLCVIFDHAQGAELLTAKELKPHLLHPDYLVRDAVAEYFKDSWSQDPDLVPMVLEAVRRYGPHEVRAGLVACQRFRLTERSLDGVLMALSDIEDDVAAFHLNALIGRAPADLLNRHEAPILDAPNLFADTAERLHRRRELYTWPAEKLWSELEDLADRSRNRYVGEIDHGYAEDLIDTLSGYAEPGVAKICELLTADGASDWLEIFVVELAGARGIHEAIPRLVDKFRIDTDYLLECAVRALARIGDPSASRLIQSVFSAEDWNFRNYASGVLAAIKSEASEEALLDLLGTERDSGIRVWLCLGLCQQFSLRGLPVILEEIDRGYDESAASLEEEMLPVAELLGVGLPEADAWRQRAEESRARFESRKLELDTLASRMKPDEDEFDLFGESPGSYRRTQPKIGRNAPCPCGSGRKFKKCCGSPTG